VGRGGGDERERGRSQEPQDAGNSANIQIHIFKAIPSTGSRNRAYNIII
jgi:hypothetical protein